MKKKTLLFQILQWLYVLICVVIAMIYRTTAGFIVGGVIACIGVGLLEIPRFHAEITERKIVDKIKKELKDNEEHIVEKMETSK